MPLIQDLLNEIDSAVVDFEKVIPSIEKEVAGELARLFAELDTRGGFLKPTVKNLRTVQRLKNKIKAAIVNKSYTTNVDGLLKSFSTVSGIQDQYFSTLTTTFEKSAVLKEVEKLARLNTIESLTGAGIESQMVEQILDKALNNVKSASSFVDLRDELDFFIKGNAEFPGKLQAYSGLIVRDSINQFSASYSETVAADLGLKWFQYVGSTVSDSRAWCVQMVKKKYIHESELPKLITGPVNGVAIPKYDKTGLPQGMIAGTNAQNVKIRRGGWNCMHQLIPVATSNVPKSVRDKIVN